MPETTLTAQQFADFRAVISAHLGIKLPEGKRVMLQSRLGRRLRELGVETVAEYHARFFGDPAHQAVELEHLLNLATTNKTDFFREPDHFDVLAREVLPAWRAAGRGGVFRVWCAGCSTGEEAYTLALTLAAEAARAPFEFRVFATDVCTRVLATARRAIYPEAHAAPIPEELRRKHLLRSRDRAAGLVRIAPELRAHVQFAHLNFLAEDYGLRDAFDAVFFRNVMIYFDRPTQQRVVSRICRHLRPDGWLFCAHAENLQGLPLPLRNAGLAVYRHAPAAAPRAA